MTATQDWSDLSLISLFRLEVETQVNELNHHLLILEQSGGVNPSSLDVLMRAAHSIKGAARIVQVEAAVRVAHVLEDCFTAAQAGTLTLVGDHVDTLLLGVDFFTRLSSLEEAELLEQLSVYDAEAIAIVQTIKSLQQPASHLPAKDLPAKDLPVKDLPAKDLPAKNLPVKDLPVKDLPVKDLLIEDPPASVIDPPTTTDCPAFLPLETLPDSAVRMIRISADNLNRIMGLAGESLVESTWLEPFTESLMQLKRQQQTVVSLLEKHQQGAAKKAKPDGFEQRDRSQDPTQDLSDVLQKAQSCYHMLSEQLSDLDLFSRRFGQLSDRLHREVIASHMCAFEESTKGYGRLTRDLARKLNKRVFVEIVGLRTQVDRDILDRLDAPITHLLTNAIAHGIEPAETRLALGKPAEGKIRIEAMHRSGMLIISVEDDGGGIDFGALSQKIVEKGLTTVAVAARLSEAELLEFLFLPGFSTAAQVDEVAGRGYGLDLARNMAQSVGGSLQVVSAIGGTRFQFRLPLTLSVVRSLLFEISGEPYAIALTRIERVLKLNSAQIYYSENRPYFTLADDRTGSAVENVSLVLLSEILALSASESSNHADADRSVLVIGEKGNRYGLCVDKLLEEKDLVVRPLDIRLGKVPNISAAALSEKGDPILMVDAIDLLHSAERIASESFQPGIESVQAGSKATDKEPLLSSSSAQRRVLVVDDSITVRAMEKKLLQNRGYAVDIAVNGLEGWNTLRTNDYDLVITDVDMPRMNGIELIQQIRAYAPTQKLPVIVVSYKDRAEDQLAGLNAGANYYLTKSSFHDDGLINAVVDLIGE